MHLNKKVIHLLLVGLLAGGLWACDDGDSDAVDAAPVADAGPGADMAPGADSGPVDPDPEGLAEIMYPEVLTAQNGVLRAQITVAFAENTLVQRDIATGEITSRINEGAFEWLDAPVLRVTAQDTPVPYDKVLERGFLPQVEDIVAAARRLTAY